MEGKGDKERGGRWIERVSVREMLKRERARWIYRLKGERKIQGEKERQSGRDGGRERN